MPLPRLSFLALCVCASLSAQERQVTFAPHGHILTNTAAWSADGQWLVYDVRDLSEDFTGNRIERVNVHSDAVEVVYHAPGNSACGVVTCHPRDPVMVFIQGPEQPQASWDYAACRRRGVTVDLRLPEGSRSRPLDAANYAPPFNTGALRGGSHVHVFSGDGRWVSFTYEDELLTRPGPDLADPEPNQRNIGVSVPSGPVVVDHSHPHNHDGDWFTVLVSLTVGHPRPGSDEINRACEEGWIGSDGYLRADGTRQAKSLAFQGRVIASDGREHQEVFVLDLPDDLTQPGDGPLTGSLTEMPRPPLGVVQRRITFTENRPYRGIQGPRHWLRSSPDGSAIAFLMNDDSGVVQCWLVSPASGAARQLTRLTIGPGIASAFSWSPDGSALAAVIDGNVCLINATSGNVTPLTSARADPTETPLDLACIFSPDGKRIAFQRRVSSPDGQRHAQIFVVETIHNPTP